MTDALLLCETASVCAVVSRVGVGVELSPAALEPVTSTPQSSIALMDFASQETLGRPTHGAPLQPHWHGAPLRPVLSHARKAGRALSRLARPLLLPHADASFERPGAQELVGGNSPAARRLPRWQMGRDGQAAPTVRQSSGSPRPLSQQANLGPFGVVSWHAETSLESESARAACQPVRIPNARTVRGRRVSRAGRGAVF